MAAATKVKKTGNALTRKVGPLPAWAWAIIAGGALYLYRNRKGGSSSGAGPSSGGDPNEVTTIPANEPGPEGPAGPTGPPGPTAPDAPSTKHKKPRWPRGRTKVKVPRRKKHHHPAHGHKGRAPEHRKEKRHKLAPQHKANPRGKNVSDHPRHAAAHHRTHQVKAAAEAPAAERPSEPRHGHLEAPRSHAFHGEPGARHRQEGTGHRASQPRHAASAQTSTNRRPSAVRSSHEVVRSRAAITHGEAKQATKRDRTSKRKKGRK